MHLTIQTKTFQLQIQTPHCPPNPFWNQLLMFTGYVICLCVQNRKSGKDNFQTRSKETSTNLILDIHPPKS